jgi:hypothetical protein
MRKSVQSRWAFRPLADPTVGRSSSARAAKEGPTAILPDRSAQGPPAGFVPKQSLGQAAKDHFGSRAKPAEARTEAHPSTHDPHLTSRLTTALPRQDG